MSHAHLPSSAFAGKGRGGLFRFWPREGQIASPQCFTDPEKPEKPERYRERKSLPGFAADVSLCAGWFFQESVQWLRSVSSVRVSEWAKLVGGRIADG
jgi:hypothetical protein